MPWEAWAPAFLAFLWALGLACEFPMRGRMLEEAGPWLLSHRPPLVVGSAAGLDTQRRQWRSQASTIHRRSRLPEPQILSDLEEIHTAMQFAMCRSHPWEQMGLYKHRAQWASILMHLAPGVALGAMDIPLAGQDQEAHANPGALLAGEGGATIKIFVKKEPGEGEDASIILRREKKATLTNLVTVSALHHIDGVVMQMTGTGAIGGGLHLQPQLQRPQPPRPPPPQPPRRQPLPQQPAQPQPQQPRPQQPQEKLVMMSPTRRNLITNLDPMPT
mmetsp:Transcript_33568/g.78455  ORF Transcript_33568/g.78455 Transcript_33568/m.78455 type:complete len:274 (+) Transcript_33568:173-994(+)